MTVTQPDLFDASASQAAAEAGMAQALDNSEGSRWRLEFERAVCQLAARGVSFISDDVRALVGDPPASVHPNAAGAVMHSLARAGVIRQVGYARSSRVVGHRNVVALWIGA